jgi:gliding motility-associated-like protein
MRFILLSCFSLLSLLCLGEGAVISGKTLAIHGSTEVYTVAWSQWNNTYEGYANVTWNVTGGTVVNSDKHSVTIQWHTLTGFLDAAGNIAVSEDLGAQDGETSVTVENTNTTASEFCEGILGPPSIADNFGNGGNPGPPLAAGITTYQYSAGCSLVPGQYTVRNNSAACRSLWHNIAQDHTGNPLGYFLMVNANDSRNEIYRKTVNGLTTAFKYEFSAWVGNLYNIQAGDDPNIRFEIYDPNGNLLASSGTIDIPVTEPVFQWQKVGFMFDIPTGYTSVQVVIVNTRRVTNDGGNDMVIDDISFAPCYPGIIASFAAASVVEKAYTCNNGTVSLFSTWPSTIPFVNPSYQWQQSIDKGITWANIAGATTINYVKTESVAGIYQYRMLSFETANSSQKVTSNVLTYFVQKMIVKPNTTSFFACPGVPAAGQLGGVYNLQYADSTLPASLAFTYLWSPATYLTNTTNMPAYFTAPVLPTPPGNGPPQPAVTYNYTLTVTNTNYGCSGSGPQTVKVIRPRKVGVPNAFTPGKPPPNNVFVPINIEDYPGAVFRVWNRWGQMVFYSTGPTKQDYSWDGKYKGKLQPADVYFWDVWLPACPTNIVSASNGDGVSYGDVTLLR